MDLNKLAIIRHAYYRLYAYVRAPMLAAGWNRDRLMAAIEAEGVPCQSGSCSEIYLEAAFPERWRPRARHLPLTRALGGSSGRVVIVFQGRR